VSRLPEPARTADAGSASRLRTSRCLEEVQHGSGEPRVCIRPAAPSDAPLLATLVRNLSAMARYRRFNTGVVQLPAAVVEALARFDPASEIVLLATVRDAGREIAVGEARLVTGEGDATTREFALAVADAMLGCGLGTRLLRALIDHAARIGVRRVYGDVLVENRPMLALAEKLGFVLRVHQADSRLIRAQRDVHARMPWSPRAIDAVGDGEPAIVFD